MSNLIKLRPVGSELFHAGLGGFWNREDSLSLTDIEPRTVQPLSNCYSDLASPEITIRTT